MALAGGCITRRRREIAFDMGDCNGGDRGRKVRKIRWSAARVITIMISLNLVQRQRTASAMANDRAV